MEYAFRFACFNGHLPVAQWLLDMKPNINISANMDFAFKYACGNGHLPVAQWLFNIKPSINIAADDEWVFRSACENGHLHVAQWLNPDKYIVVSNKNKLLKWNINTDDKKVLRLLHQTELS